MGCLVNPTSIRLGISKFWVSKSWFTKKNYSVFLLKDLLLYNYLFSFFYLLKTDKYFFDYRLADISIHRVSTKTFINLFFYKENVRFKTYNYKEFLKFFFDRLMVLNSQKSKFIYLQFLTQLLNEKVYKPFFFNQLIKEKFIETAKLSKSPQIEMKVRYKILQEARKEVEYDFLLLSLKYKYHPDLKRGLVKAKKKLRRLFHKDLVNYGILDNLKEESSDGSFVFSKKQNFSEDMFFGDDSNDISPKDQKRYDKYLYSKDISRSSFFYDLNKKFYSFDFFGNRKRFFDIIERENRFLYDSLKILVMMKFGRRSLFKMRKLKKGLLFVKGRNLWILKKKLLKLRAKIFSNRSKFFKTLLEYRDFSYSLYGYIEGRKITALNRRRTPFNMGGRNFRKIPEDNLNPVNRNKNYDFSEATLTARDQIIFRNDIFELPVFLLYLFFLQGRLKKRFPNLSNNVNYKNKNFNTNSRRRFNNNNRTKFKNKTRLKKKKNNKRNLARDTAVNSQKTVAR